MTAGSQGQGYGRREGEVRKATGQSRLEEAAWEHFLHELREALGQAWATPITRICIYKENIGPF